MISRQTTRARAHVKFPYRSHASSARSSARSSLTTLPTLPETAPALPSTIDSTATAAATSMALASTAPAAALSAVRRRLLGSTAEQQQHHSHAASLSPLSIRPATASTSLPSARGRPSYSLGELGEALPERRAIQARRAELAKLPLAQLLPAVADSAAAGPAAAGGGLSAAAAAIDEVAGSRAALQQAGGDAARVFRYYQQRKDPEVLALSHGLESRTHMEVGSIGWPGAGRAHGSGCSHLAQPCMCSMAHTVAVSIRTHA
jgi:hypothetical protein